MNSIINLDFFSFIFLLSCAVLGPESQSFPYLQHSLVKSPRTVANTGRGAGCQHKKVFSICFLFPIEVNRGNQVSVKHNLQ